MKRVMIVTTLLTLASPALAHFHHHYRHHHTRYHHYHRYHPRSFFRYRRHAENHSAAHDLIVSSALAMGISRPVIEHVANKESGFRCSPPGHYNGPLQILASTARAFGFHGGSLNNCGAGLHFGLMHLKMCVSRYGNNPYAVASCHARGS